MILSANELIIELMLFEKRRHRGINKQADLTAIRGERGRTMKIFSDLNEAIKTAQEVGTMECPAILISRWGNKEHYLTDRTHYQQELAQIKMDWIAFTEVRVYVGVGRPYDNWTWENDYVSGENCQAVLPDISSKIIQELNKDFSKWGRPDPDLIRRQMVQEGWNYTLVHRLSDQEVLRANKIQEWDDYERYMNCVLGRHDN